MPWKETSAKVPVGRMRGSLPVGNKRLNIDFAVSVEISSCQRPNILFLRNKRIITS